MCSVSQMLSSRVSPVPAGTTMLNVVVTGLSMSGVVTSWASAIGPVAPGTVASSGTPGANDTASDLTVGALPGPPLLLLQTVTIRAPLSVSPARPAVKTVFENTYGAVAPSNASLFTRSEFVHVAPPFGE